MLLSKVLRSDRSAQLLFRVLLTLYVISLVSLELFCIMPTLFPGYCTSFLVYFILGAYLLVGFVYNAVQIVHKDPSIRGLLLVNKVTRSWTYCVPCQTPRPPRTHHCHVCNTCVLRRDHHCVLLARCIGLRNWRYFFSLLVFGSLGAGLASRFNLSFVFGNHIFPEDRSPFFCFLCFIAPPGFLWILGQLTLWQTLIFTMTTTCFLFSCFLTAFTFYYLAMISRNQTLSDKMARSKALAVDPDLRTCETTTILANTDVNLYDVGWKANISQFLGENWILSVFFPFTQSTPTTDGLFFPHPDTPKLR